MHVFNFRNVKTETNVQIGFGIVLVSIVFLTVFSIYQIQLSNKSISKLVENNFVKTALAHEMRDAILQRQVIMNSMYALDDFFERDDKQMEFYNLASNYRVARVKLLALSMNNEEKTIHQKIQKQIKISQPLSRTAMEILREGDEAKNIHMVEEAQAHQNRVLFLLTKLVNVQKKYAVRSHIESKQIFTRSLYIILVLGICVCLVGYLVSRIVTRMVAESKTQLLNKNSELEIANMNATSATRTKSAFLATMSHEIRTPLTAIIGFAEACLDNDMSQKEKNTSVQTIALNGKHLLHIINDILDISKIEANKLELEPMPVNIFQIMGDIERLVYLQAQEKGISINIEFEYPIPKFVKTDPIRLKQIILNICGNAIKFTQKGYVNIHTKYKKENNEIVFDVVDTGIGMTQEQTEKVFNAFEQADSSTSRKYGGTGLGLSLSKQLAKMLGGDISVKSLQHVGSKFRLTIPAGDIEQNHLIISQKDNNYTANNIHLIAVNKKLSGTVLLAEDNIHNQRLITLLLNKMGLQVDLADNGKIAVEKASQRHYELIFMDMQMPIMNGIEATKIIRKTDLEVPIISLTANAMKEDREKCKSAGCSSFLTKPIDTDALYQTAASFINASDNSELSSSITSLFDDDKNIPNGNKKHGNPYLQQNGQVQDIIDKYVSELPNYVKTILENYANSNWDQLKIELHDLKGFGATAGFPDLSTVASELEQEIKQQNSQHIQRLIFQLENIVNSIHEEKDDGIRYVEGGEK